MAEELEVGALAALDGTGEGGGSGDESGAPCRNCHTSVSGRYCSECGQLAQNYHRPIWGLMSEMLGDFLSLDGRVMQTIPALIFRPGSVTRAYLDGKRQRFVPPFRLYLLTSFIFFLALFSFGSAKGWFDTHYITPEQYQAAMLDELVVRAEADAVQADGIEPDVVAEEISTETRVDSKSERPLIRPDGQVDRDKIREIFVDNSEQVTETDEALIRMGNKFADAYENQGMFFASLKNWAPRVALAFTPALILLLIIVYPFRRGVYVYDHVITAMHLQSWLYILLCTGLIFFWFNQAWFAFFLFLLPPIYLYRLMRVVYNSGRFTSLFRMLMILFFLTTLLVILSGVLLLLGVAETAPTIRSLSQN